MISKKLRCYAAGFHFVFFNFGDAELSKQIFLINNQFANENCTDYE